MSTVKTQNFVKILKAVFEIWTKNIKNAPKRGVFPHLRPPRIFSKIGLLSLLYPYGALTSCKKLEKSLERSLRYLKTDHGRTDMGDYIGPSRVNLGSKMRKVDRAHLEKRFDTHSLSTKYLRCLHNLFLATYVIPNI